MIMQVPPPLNKSYSIGPLNAKSLKGPRFPQLPGSTMYLLLPAVEERQSDGVQAAKVASSGT